MTPKRSKNKSEKHSTKVPLYRSETETANEYPDLIEDESLSLSIMKIALKKQNRNCVINPEKEVRGIS
jgi:hypothetical protein